jgi:hypothetical protein
MKMTYGKSPFAISVPAGWYTAKFIGVVEREPIKDDKFGRGSVERMAWKFEITDGPRRGETIEQESGRVPSPKSTCARIVAGLSGGKIAVGDEVDPDYYVGKLYKLKVSVNPNSDKGNLHVSDIEPLDGLPSSAPPAAAAATTTNGDCYWIDSGNAGVTKGTSEDVRHLIFSGGYKAADLQIRRVGENDWKPASEFGFEDARF